MTPVVFRTWRKPHADVIALFPTIPESRGCVMSYQHIGQHGGADYHHVIRQTRPATPEESANLARELTQIGYELDVQRHVRCSRYGTIRIAK